MQSLKPQFTVKLLQSERGFLLVASLLISAIVVSLGAAVSFTVMNNQLVARNVGQVSSARFEADGGIDAVLAYFRSGEANITFIPDPVESPGAAFYEIDLDTLQNDINAVLGSVGLENDAVILSGSDLVEDANPGTRDSLANPNAIEEDAFYITLNSQFNNEDNRTRSTRAATIQISVNWLDINNTTIDTFYGVETEKSCTVNGNTDVDTDVYCGSSITFNGGISKSKEAGGGLVTIKTGPTLTQCNSKQYCVKGSSKLIEAGNMLKEPRTIEVPTSNEVRDAALNNLRAELNIPNNIEDFGAYINSNKVVIKPSLVNQNNAALFNTTLTAAILAAGGGLNGCSNGKVIYLTGGIAIPGGVNLSNCIFVVQSGDLNFNGTGNHTNTVFVTETGSMNFNGSHTYDNSALVSGNNVNLNNTPIFKDANGDGKSLGILSTKGNLNINGGFKQQDDVTELFIVSQGDITFNGSAKTTAGVIAGGSVRFNGQGGLTGYVRARNEVLMNGGINTKDFTDPFRKQTVTTVYVPVLNNNEINLVTRQ